MKQCLLVLLFVSSILISGRAQGSTYQEQVYLARDLVLPALIHIQPVVEDFQTGEL